MDRALQNIIVFYSHQTYVMALDCQELEWATQVDINLGCRAVIEIADQLVLVERAS